jgi:hypothetical protein
VDLMPLKSSITPFQATGSSGNGGSVTLPSGTNRKILVGFTKEVSSTVSALTFDGTGFVANLAISILSTANNVNGSEIYWYDVPDAKDAGTYALNWNQTASVTARRAYVVVLVGAATGEPEWENAAFLDGDGVDVTASLTSVSAGAYVFAIGQCSSSSRTYTWASPLTERYDETIDAAYQSTMADYDDATAGNVTVTSTLSATGSTNRQTLAVVAVAAAAPSAPVITVQPVADVGIISNGQSTVYTGTATGTTISAFTWEVDGTPIADGGVYDIVTTGIGTGSASSTLTITRTDKTGTPFDINFDVTDANGTTASNTVTDTWWTGPVVTTFPATDGSGESTATLTSDYVTGVGEAIEVRIPLSDGDVAVTVTTT